MSGYFRTGWVLLQLLVVKIGVGWVLILCTSFLRPYLPFLGFLGWTAVSACIFLACVVPFWLKAEAELRGLGRP